MRNIFIDHVGADGIDIKNRNLDNNGIVLDGIFVNEHAIRSNLVGQTAIDIRGESTLSNIFCKFTSLGNTDKGGIRIRQGAVGNEGGRRSSLTNFVVKGSGQTSGSGLVIKGDNCHASNGWISGSVNSVFVGAVTCSVSNVSVEGGTVGFRADSAADDCVFASCHTVGATNFGFQLDAPGQQIIGGAASGSGEGVRITATATNARIIGLDLTGAATPVNDLGTDTVGVLCPGWIGTGGLTTGGHVLVGNMAAYDEPITGRPFLHIGDNINGSATPNGELILGHVSAAVMDDILGQVSFYSSDESGSAKGRQAAIKGISTHSAGVFGSLGFFTGTGADDASVERMRVFHNGNVGIGETAPNYTLDVNGSFGFTPGASVTPVDNGDVVFELTNNMTLTVKARGSDGVVRSGTIALA